MADPAGMKMSLYGKSELTPEELAGLLKNVKRRTDYIRNKHLAIVGNNTKLLPGIKRWTKTEIMERIAARETSIYGPRKRPTVAAVDTPYNRLYHTPDTYDCKVHRDDRKSSHTIGCSVHEEEAKRAIPMTSSANYGHRLSTVLEPFERGHVRVMHVVKGFYYRRGTGLPPIDT